MAAKHKSSTAELIAIYRLEFYRKQKNWKFCNDVCKKVDPEPDPEPAKDPKSEFNKTYNVDAEADTETASPLNHAFLETDVDKFLPETPPDPETDKVWPEHFIEQHNKTSHEDHDSRHELWGPPEPCAGWAAAEAWRPAASLQALWRDAPQEVVLEGGQEFYGQRDCNANCVAAGWPGSTHAWAMRAAHLEANDEGGVSEAAAGELLRAADRWLSAGQALHDASLESFMLGAAAAPHSSELDLRPSTAGSACSLSVSGVSRLSGAQLAARLGSTARALRRLLREAGARLSTQLGHSQSLDEPTRDPGPCPPPRPPPLQRQETYVKDCFVAGSFKGPEESLPGRGRGRLRVRPGVIGIGMGRPYRL